MLVALEDALFFPLVTLTLIVVAFALERLYREYLKRIDAILEMNRNQKLIEEDFKRIKDEFDENYNRVKRENNF